MDGRSNTLILAAMLAASALTGCIANPLEALSAEVEVSAFENKDAADKAAAEWSPEARLVGVLALELTKTMDERIQTDPSVGNGLAPAWWYVYAAPAASQEEASSEEETTGPSGFRAGEEKDAPVVETIRAFKVTADGTVSSEDDAAMMAEGIDHDAEPIGAWEVDSYVVLETAKQNASFRRVAEGPNATVVEGVGSEDGQAIWFASAMSAEGWVSAILNARTGELLELEEMTMDIAMPAFDYGSTAAWMAEPVHLEGEGVSNAGDELAEFPFTAGAAMMGQLSIELAADFPIDGLHWAILDEDGEWVTGDHLSGWTGGDSYVADVEIEEEGDHTFLIGYMSSVPVPGSPLPTAPLGGAVAYEFTLDLAPGYGDIDVEG